MIIQRVHQARALAAARIQQQRAQTGEALSAENRVYRERVAEAGAQGRDEKHLDEDTEEARVMAAERTMFHKKLAQEQLKSENRLLLQRLREVVTGRDQKVLDDDVEEARVAAGTDSFLSHVKL